MGVLARTGLAIIGAAVVTFALFAIMPLMLRVEPRAYPHYEFLLAEPSPSLPLARRTGGEAQAEMFRIICHWFAWPDPARPRVVMNLAEPLPPGHVYAPPLATREAALEPVRIELI